MENRFFSYPIFILVILLSGVFGLAKNSEAVPSVSGVSGTVTSGATVTVSGSGFGNKSPVAPYLWADFGNGSISPSSLGRVTAWAEIQSMAYNSTCGPTGGGCAQSTDQSGIWTLRVDSTGFNWTDFGRQVYIYRKIKMNFNPITQTPNWKVWRMWAAGNSPPDVYVNIQNGCAFVEYTDMVSCNWFDSSAFLGPQNFYNVEELIVRSNSSASASDGILQLYENGIQAAAFSNMDYNNGTGVMVMNYVVHGVIANGTVPTGSIYQAVDVYVDATWQRAMICDAASWSARSHCEIQIPQTIWTDNGQPDGARLQIKVNQGSFADGSIAYLYVIDASGTPNTSGKAIQFGSGSSATSPAAPIGLSVQ